MTKKIADKVLKINKEMDAIQKELGINDWNKICMEASKFIIRNIVEGQNVKS